MTETALLLGGALLIGAAGIWRAHHRSAFHKEVARALADDDPAVRATALHVLAGSGLRRWSGELSSLVQTLDPRSLRPDQEARAAELAWLITVCQWEPADEPAILQLRLWAKRYHQFHEATPGDSAEENRPVVGSRSSMAAAAEQALGEPVTEIQFWPRTRARSA